MQENNYNINIDIHNYDKTKIKNKIYTFNNIEYCILNYNRNYICYDDYENSKYRSIVLSHPENKLLCFSCPKSITYDIFIEKYPDITNDIIVNDIIEGTMINVFYDDRINSWNISTKSAIGGNYWYFRNQYYNTEKSQKTFYDMFLESLSCDNINNLNFLNKDYCYNFVLQHPDNHIVLNILKPTSYLISIYEIKKNIDDNVTSIVYISPAIFSKWDCFNNTSVLFPIQYDNETYSSLKQKYDSLYNNLNNVGVMITHINTGERTYIKNNAYEYAKDLRGNNPNLLYQYICLLKTDKVNDYLRFFPQYKKLFYNFYKNYKDFIQTIHYAYITYYIKKEKNVNISKKYFYHIHYIHHQIYVPSLSNKIPTKITKQIIFNYINNMTPMQIFHYLQTI